MIKIPKTSDAKVEKLKSIFDKMTEDAILIESDDEEQDFVFYRAKSKSQQDSAVVTPASQVQLSFWISYVCCIFFFWTTINI